jgi:hypothetical protein
MTLPWYWGDAYSSTSGLQLDDHFSEEVGVQAVLVVGQVTEHVTVLLYPVHRGEATGPDPCPPLSFR